jgi:hypothetical protein
MMENVTIEPSQQSTLPEAPQVQEQAPAAPLAHKIPEPSLKNMEMVAAAPKEVPPGLRSNAADPIQENEPPIKRFDDPRFWKGFYDAIERNVVSGRVPKFFCISPARAEKFLVCAKTQFPNFDASKIKTAEELSMNIMKKDGSGSYPLGIVISNFVVDKPDEDCGIFV